MNRRLLNSLLPTCRLLFVPQTLHLSCCEGVGSLVRSQSLAGLFRVSVNEFAGRTGDSATGYQRGAPDTLELESLMV